VKQSPLSAIAEDRRRADEETVPLWERLVPSFRAAFMAIERVEEQLHRFTKALDTAGVPYAVVGGNAVAAWVSTIDPDATRTTKDVDVLMRRCDLERAAKAVEPAGMIREEVLGIPVFLEKENPSPKRGVHVILADEPIRPGYPSLAPSVTSSRRSDLGFIVIDLAELVRMKLEANRRHDQVHMEDMLRIGLIDAGLAAKLPAELLDRLRYVRDTMEWFTKPPSF
jgi:hypothetical protein